MGPIYVSHPIGLLYFIGHWTLDPSCKVALKLIREKAPPGHSWLTTSWVGPILEQPADKYLMDTETLPNFIIARKHRPDDKPSVCTVAKYDFIGANFNIKKKKTEAKIMQ
jgi:hypothetical protein